MRDFCLTKDRKLFLLYNGYSFKFMLSTPNIFYCNLTFTLRLALSSLQAVKLFVLCSMPLHATDICICEKLDCQVDYWFPHFKKPYVCWWSSTKASMLPDSWYTSWMKVQEELSRIWQHRFTGKLCIDHCLIGDNCEALVSVLPRQEMQMRMF